MTILFKIGDRVEGQLPNCPAVVGTIEGFFGQGWCRISRTIDSTKPRGWLAEELTLISRKQASRVG